MLEHPAKRQGKNGAPVSPPRERLETVQVLRALAAYLVVQYHVTASLAGEQSHGAIFVAGKMGVDIFFILSGFLMALLAERESGFGKGLLLRRVARIVPLYYLMTLALFALALVAPGLLNSAATDPLHLGASLLFVPYDDGNGAMNPVLGLGWTLNYEMFFYVVMAVYLKLTGDRTLTGVVIVLAGLVATGQVLESDSVPVRFYTDPIILEFAAGILAYRFFYRGGVRLGRGTCWAMLAAAVAATALHGDDATNGDQRLLALGMPAMLIVVAGIHCFPANAAWLGRLGDWSYATYLLHVYVIQFAVKLVLPVESALADPLLLSVLVLPVIVFGSALLHRFVEMPAMRLVKDCGRRAPAQRADAEKGLSAPGRGA